MVTTNTDQSIELKKKKQKISNYFQLNVFKVTNAGIMLVFGHVGVAVIRVKYPIGKYVCVL